MPARTPLTCLAMTAVAVSALLSGCTTDAAAPTSANGAGEAAAPSASPLAADTRWRLEGVTAGALDAAAVREEMGDTTLALSNGRAATGTAGCRTFEAEYEIIDSELVQITTLDVDESGCDTVYPALGSFTSFVTLQRLRATLRGEVLTLASLDGAYALVFGAVDD